MSKNIETIYMNKEILNIIHLVLNYANFIQSKNLIEKNKNFDWYKKTKKYYKTLDLPYGIKTNDFKNIIQYYYLPSLLEEMDNTESVYLNKYIWNKDFNQGKKLNKKHIKSLNIKNFSDEFEILNNKTFSFYIKLPKEIINYYKYLLTNNDGTMSQNKCIESLFVQYKIDEDLMYYSFIFEDCSIDVNDTFNIKYLNDLVYNKYKEDYKYS